MTRPSGCGRGAPAPAPAPSAGTRAPGELVRSVCQSGDGRQAVSGSEDRALRVWEVASGLCLRTLQGHTAIVNSVSLSGDGRLALSGSTDKALRLWEVATGRCLRTF